MYDPRGRAQELLARHSDAVLAGLLMLAVGLASGGAAALDGGDVALDAISLGDVDTTDGGTGSGGPTTKK